MSLQSRFNRSNRCTISGCAMAIAVAVMMNTPMWAHADGTEMSDSTSMPSESMEHSKTDGMKHMDDMSMTGDTDYDFAANMRTHHQMAVDMSEAQVKNGKNPQIVQMAKDIIAAQTKEITVLDEWLEAYKKP